MKIVEVLDEMLSGLQMHIVPIDELLLGDFFTFELQRQPYILRVRRIPWDEARAIYGHHKDFKYVQAGKTRIFITGQENQTLYDIEWTEADRDYVQEITAYYRSEDLQVTFVGGVFMGNEKDIYNSNPFEHRKLVLDGEDIATIPVYPFAKGGFEPLDATGRFAYYKSAAFKSFWDDASINKMYQMIQDGTYLDVIRPLLISGVSKIDGAVVAPGAVTALPKDAAVTPFSLGSNLNAALTVLELNKNDLSESTQDSVQGGVAEKGVTARATIIAEQNAKVILGVFGLMLANVVEQVGALTIDCIISHATIAEVDNAVPGTLKYKTFLVKERIKNGDVSNKIIFTDEFMGVPMSSSEQETAEWSLYDSLGRTAKERARSSESIFLVNPYEFARLTYTLRVDADQIVSRSMGTDRQRRIDAFELMTDPRAAPYIDQRAVVEDFVVDTFAEGDNERYLKPENTQAMLNSVMSARPEEQLQEQPLPSLA